MPEQIPISDLKVKHYMTTNPVTINSNVNFAGGIAVMVIKGIGNLIVKRNQRAVGILTEREIIQHLSYYKEIPNKLLDNMVLQPFFTVHPNTLVLHAARIMIEKKGRILVFDGNDDDNENKSDDDANHQEEEKQQRHNKNEKLVGIITASDMVRAFATQTNTSPSLEPIMTRRIFSVEINNNISRAVDIMWEEKVGSVMVNKDEKSYGIFTERDLLKKVLLKEVSLQERVGDYCSNELITAKIGEFGITALEAADTMRIAKIKRLPLRSDDKIVGIITARDLVELYKASHDKSSDKH
jgi:CBS domain-containing protein